MLVSGRVFKQFHWSIVSWSIYVLFLWGLFGWPFKVLNSFLRCFKSKVIGKDLTMVNRCFQIHPVEYGKLILKAGFCCLTMFDTSLALRFFFYNPVDTLPWGPKNRRWFVQKRRDYVLICDMNSYRLPFWEWTSWTGTSMNIRFLALPLCPKVPNIVRKHVEKKQRSFCKERKLTDCSSNPCYSPSFCPYDCTHLGLIHRWESPFWRGKITWWFSPETSKPAANWSWIIIPPLCQCLITIVFSFHVCILIKKLSHVDKVSLVHIIL